MICLDEDALLLYGDFNALEARQLNIQLVKCIGGVEGGCKSDAEIMKFFRNKWIVMFYN